MVTDAENEVWKSKVADLEAALSRRDEQLARAKAELVECASTVAHDLRSPLVTISGYCDLLRHEYKGCLDESADRYLQAVVDAVGRMNRLLADLLSYAQLRPIDRRTAKVELDRVFADVVANLDGAVRQTGATVAVESLPSVRGSHSALVQLFQNLIGNAIKFHGDEPPVVRISSSRESSGHVVRVTDNGVGIEPEHREAVFRVLHRLAKSRQLPGSGIGLAICKKIVESHEGRIWVESAPDGGATFLVWLPGAD